LRARRSGGARRHAAPAAHRRSPAADPCQPFAAPAGGTAGNAGRKVPGRPLAAAARPCWTYGGDAVGVTEVPADLQARDRLVMAHVSLVKVLAQRLAHRLPREVEIGELISVGVMGLVEAANRYRPSLGVPFDAFARRRVHGAMLDALRSMDCVPRSMRRLRREVDGVIGRLRHEHGREPTEAEIAKALGRTPEEDRKSTRLNSSHVKISYAVFCLKQKTHNE